MSPSRSSEELAITCPHPLHVKKIREIFWEMINVCDRSGWTNGDFKSLEPVLENLKPAPDCQYPYGNITIPAERLNEQSRLSLLAAMGPEDLIPALSQLSTENHDEAVEETTPQLVEETNETIFGEAMEDVLDTIMRISLDTHDVPAIWKDAHPEWRNIIREEFCREIAGNIFGDTQQYVVDKTDEELAAYTHEQNKMELVQAFALELANDSRWEDLGKLAARYAEEFPWEVIEQFPVEIDEMLKEDWDEAAAKSVEDT